MDEIELKPCPFCGGDGTPRSSLQIYGMKG